MGLVNRVVPKADLVGHVREVAASVGGNAPMTIATLKATVAEALKDAEERDLPRIAGMIEACFASEDYQEGRTAFMEKRKPRFNNR